MTAFKRIIVICTISCLAVLLVFWKCAQGGPLFTKTGDSDALLPSFLLESLLDRNCENSGQGKFVISDSKGFICERHEVNLSTGCCNTGFDFLPDLQESEENSGKKSTVTKHHQRLKRRFECSKCNPDIGCCLDYENCISCCLKPSNLQKYLIYYLTLDLLKRPDAESGTSKVVHSQFAYCKHVCRTSSLSLQAENSYRGFHNSCFGLKAGPMERTSVNSDFAGVPEFGKLKINEINN